MKIVADVIFSKKSNICIFGEFSTRNTPAANSKPYVRPQCTNPITFFTFASLIL